MAAAEKEILTQPQEGQGAASYEKKSIKNGLERRLQQLMEFLKNLPPGSIGTHTSRTAKD